tara:strand:- start:302 stop:733 length:432 start_codon:yes stop_codon:yes gene_type:complete
MGMFNFIGHLFSSDESAKTTNKVIDNVSYGLDKLILTDEERLDYNKDAMGLWMKMQGVLGDENSVRAKARRFLAMGVFITFLITFALVVIHAVLGFWFKIDVKPLIENILTVTKTFMLGELTLTTFVFYFGKGIVDRLGGSKK